MTAAERPEAPPSVPGRVRVTSPLTDAPAHVRRSVAQEIDETSGVGEAYVRSLMRTQLRGALTVVAVVVATIGSLPLLFVLVDPLAQAEVFGVPIVWPILGLGVYPWLLVLAWRYVRFAERTEREFTDLIEGP